VIQTSLISKLLETRDRRYHFLRPIPIFSIFSQIFHQWLIFDWLLIPILAIDIHIRLDTDTNISKFAYRCICRYFNKVFWL